MSPNRSRTPKSDSHTYNGRRRHAAPKEPRWARRAGLVGGVFSALAFGGAAAPAMADNTPHIRTTHTTHTLKSLRSSTSRASRSASWTSRTSLASLQSTLSTAASARQAAAAVAWEAKTAAFAAEREQAAAEAAKAATAARQAAHRKAEAEAKKAARAAKERAAAEAAARAKARAEAVAAAAPAKAAAPAPTTPGATVAKVAAPAPKPSASKVDQLIAFLKAQLGKPYVYGATGPDSFDCSGLTQAAFASIGIDLPRTSQEQSTVGTPVSLSALQVGDLVFWGGESTAYHVAVYIGDNQFLAAQNPSKGVVIEPMDFSMPDWAVRVL